MTNKGCGGGAHAEDGMYLAVASQAPEPAQVIEPAICEGHGCGRRFYRRRYPQDGFKLRYCSGCVARMDAQRQRPAEDFAAMKHKQDGHRRAS